MHNKQGNQEAQDYKRNDKHTVYLEHRHSNKNIMQQMTTKLIGMVTSHL